MSQDRNNSYYSDILLDDLMNSREDDRIQLNLQSNQSHRSAEANGAEANDGGAGGAAGEMMMDELEKGRVMRIAKDSFQDWQPQLEEVSPSPSCGDERGADDVHAHSQFVLDKTAVDESMEDMMFAVKQKVDRASRESGSSSQSPVQRQCLSCPADFLTLSARIQMVSSSPRYSPATKWKLPRLNSYASFGPPSCHRNRTTSQLWLSRRPRRKPPELRGSKAVWTIPWCGSRLCWERKRVEARMSRRGWTR